MGASSRHVAIIGGGVVGLCTARALIRRGFEVTLVEPEPVVGQIASRANGGQLSYHYVSPMAGAGVPVQAIAWLLRGEDGIALRLRLDPAQWRWLAGFLAACRSGANRRGGARLLRLALLSRDQLRDWRLEGLDGFCWSASGKLVLHRDAASFRKAAQSLLMPEAQQVLSAAECAALEPALATITPALAGGIHTRADETADCHLFCQALLRDLLCQPGFRLLRGTARIEPDPAGDRTCRILTGDGPLQADLFVLAAGLQSAGLMRDAGFYLPLLGLKGYSLTAGTHPGMSGRLPAISITDYDRKTVYAPLGDRFRIAASIEIGSTAPSPTPRKIDALRREAAGNFPGAADYENATPWAGFRPATPDGLPILGPSPWRNLLLNVGHGSLGFTLAAGCAAVVAALAANEPSPIPLDVMTLYAR